MGQILTSDETRELARQMRCDIISMLAEAGSGHPGGSLSAADIVATLYGVVMKHDPECTDWPERDRFVLSKGHAAPVLYAALAETGYFERGHLGTLRKLGSILQGHPDMKKTPGVEVSTGSLGQGLAISNGLGLALKIDGETAPTVFCLLGDGELQEGEVWEAAMFAPHHGLTNVVAIVDNNGLQIDGSCSEVMCLGEIALKFQAFGWVAVQCDGHDIDALTAALGGARKRAEAEGRPVVVVCSTVKGKGVSFMEGLADWHGKTPNAEQTAVALAELGCDGKES
ncbi:MAG: transketolase [Actinomycetota bacterium]|nr:transketolase [Actinomycetota bacterium]MDP3630892.1 transketolase [Actinomycetota bacterium]